MNPEYRDELEEMVDQSLDRFNIYLKKSEDYLLKKLSYIPDQSEINNLATNIMLFEKLDLIADRLSNIDTGLEMIRREM